MAQDDPPPGGLLSKVVKFVRNPTVNWSDLDQPEDKESHYSKQMLKEMIERKRANDFVRRREFDQLRKLRQRNAQGGGFDADAAERLSFFQSSLPSNSGDRAGTIKKIDEIEAQMAQHWRKPQGQQPPLGQPAPPAGVHDAAQRARQYATTVHAVLPDATQPLETDFAATDISPMEHALAPDGDPVDMVEMLDWPAAPATDQVQADFVTDPALEEASIRFANGDDTGAELALKALLDEGVGAAAIGDAMPAEHGIRLALLDLYRATGQQAAFEAAAVDFALRTDGPAPVWLPMAGGAQATAGNAPAAAPAPAPTFDWASPAVLGAEQAIGLQAVAGRHPPGDLLLDWTRLATLADDVLEPLSALFTLWTRAPVTLRMLAEERVDAQLRRRTVSGDRAASPLWWALRMDWLRITHRPDEFDLVALDYCITYEVSPPSWQDAACQVVALDGRAAAGPASVRADFGLSTIPDGVVRIAPATGALTGVIAGDATEVLSTFDAEVPATGQVVVDCAALVRIDFAAAGSVLNWAVGQQAEGRQVQFTGLHRLTATFFNVIGVSEHARIFLRRD